MAPDIVIWLGIAFCVTPSAMFQTLAAHVPVDPEIVATMDGEPGEVDR